MSARAGLWLRGPAALAPPLPSAPPAPPRPRRPLRPRRCAPSGPLRPLLASCVPARGGRRLGAARRRRAAAGETREVVAEAQAAAAEAEAAADGKRREQARPGPQAAAGCSMRVRRGLLRLPRRSLLAALFFFSLSSSLLYFVYVAPGIGKTGVGGRRCGLEGTPGTPASS